jgi:polysaccharide chain length determinant protein (PEP-CTERM system associated)
MQPTENFSIPRRALDVEDYIDILRRHKGWIFGPFLLTLVASVVGVYLWPDSYESVALIKIVPQQVPQNMVQSSITQDMSDRIASMATTVLSRNVLITIVNNFDLYKRERLRMPMEDVVENIMRKDIHITPVMAGGNGRNVPAFTVSFKYDDRLMATRVVQELDSRFISANTSDRNTATNESKDFFKEQAEQAKKEMDAIEQKLTQFRAVNNGRLPDQVEQNVRQLTGLQSTFSFLTSSRNRAENDKQMIEANLRIEKGRKAELTREVPQTAAAAAVAPKSERLQEAERDVRTLEDSLASARQRFTDEYPDVKSLRNRLDIAKKRRDEVTQEEAEAKKIMAQPGQPIVNRQDRVNLIEMDANIERLQSQSAAKDLEMAQYDSQIKQVQASMNRIESQINSAPLGEQQYSDLLRERDMAKEKYVNLSGKLSLAQISQDLESRGQGDHLELLDPPSVPQTPTEPKRPLVIGMGAGLGLLLGIVMAGAREMKDTSLKNLKDVRAYTQIAILGSVPLLENDFVVRRRRRMAWLAWTTACLLAVVTMAGSIVYYYYFYYATKV